MRVFERVIFPEAYIRRVLTEFIFKLFYKYNQAMIEKVEVMIVKPVCRESGKKTGTCLNHERRTDKGKDQKIILMN